MPDPTPPSTPPVAPPSTTSTILIKAQELGGKKFSLSVTDLLKCAVLIGIGYWWGIRACTGIDATVVRQLKGDLTEKEKAIVAADLENGKLGTQLVEKEKVEEQLKTDNGDLAAAVEREKKAHKLDVAQFSRIISSLKAERTGGRGGITDTVVASSTTPECGKCKGEIGFGQYASVGWANYASLNTPNPERSFVKLNLGVRIEQVTLRQRARDGALESVLGKVYLLGDGGEVIGEGRLEEGSRVFNAPVERGDLTRRHFYAIGGLDARSYKVGVLTQKGVRPLTWGAMLTQDFRGTGGLGAEFLLGWQLR